MTARVLRVLVVAAAAAAVAGAVRERVGDDKPRVTHVRYLVTQDAKKLLLPLVEQFNRTHDVQVDAVMTLTSGEAESAIASGGERAVLWTPASSLWGRLLDHDAHAAWVPARNPSLVSSPQVIAMWKNLAVALGWGHKKIGWTDVLALATSGRGWAAYGHPEFGSFKLGHTNPDFSTSGLSAVASEYYAITGKRTGLRLQDIRRPEVRAAVRTIERSIVHYGKTADAFTKQMDRWGSAYAQAVYVQETQLREFNKTRKHVTPLVGILPAEGTFVADYPLIVLRAPWVDGPARAAAETFRRWLVPRITASLAAASGFRLRPPTHLRTLELPRPEVLAAIQDGWHADRKPANVVLVVDTSSSMDAAGRLDAAKLGLLSFLRELTPEDRVGLVTSGSSVVIRVPLAESRRSRPAIVRAVGKLFANGELPVYGAVSRALAQVRARHDSAHINAVVVLSDGAGTSAGLSSLLRSIRAQQPTEGTSVRIFTIAYAGGANAGVLERISSASGGAFFPGGPKDITAVYRSISAFF